VYAGCVKRIDGEPFLSKDLHWKLDKSELLRRTGEWNKALDKYSDDMDLVGEDRERAVARHKASACAPCGRVGCDAVRARFGSSRAAPGAGRSRTAAAPARSWTGPTTAGNAVLSNRKSPTDQGASLRTVTRTLRLRFHKRIMHSANRRLSWQLQEMVFRFWAGGTFF
jgi:hypothetical protein